MKHELSMSKERLDKIASWREKYGAAHNVILTAEEAEAMARALLASPSGTFDAREDIRKLHAEWSQATFGDVGPVGPLKYLAKEAIEAASSPEDLSEWADCQFLLWDAQRRAGITDEQIAAACVEKLAVNKERIWPEPKDGEPRLHVKDSAPSIPAAVPDIVGKLLAILDRHTVVLGWGEKPITLAELVVARDGSDELDACRAAMLQSEPVSQRYKLPDGYVLVPVEPTEDMVINGFESEPDEHFSEPGAWEAYDAMSGCQQAAHRAKLCWAAMIAAAPKGERNRNG